MINPELGLLLRSEMEERSYDLATQRAYVEGRNFLRTARFVPPQGDFVALNPVQIQSWFGDKSSPIPLPEKYKFSDSAPIRLLHLKAKEGRVDTRNGRRNILTIQTSVYGRYSGSVLTERLFIIPDIATIYCMSIQSEGVEPHFSGTSIASEGQITVFTQLTLLGQEVAKGLRKDQRLTRPDPVRI